MKYSPLKMLYVNISYLNFTFPSSPRSFLPRSTVVLSGKGQLYLRAKDSSTYEERTTVLKSIANLLLRA